MLTYMPAPGATIVLTLLRSVARRLVVRVRNALLMTVILLSRIRRGTMTRRLGTFARVSTVAPPCVTSCAAANVTILGERLQCT